MNRTAAASAGCGAEFFGGGHRVGLRLLLADGARDAGWLWRKRRMLFERMAAMGPLFLFCYLVMTNIVMEHDPFTDL